ncbi:hypothetical protein AB0C90_09075 [Streptomyces sp. NPDC048550]|uniref:hypothetical protein n=1 Tax=unclassified Streptomyces TaxID=2593676 RepID=UPI00224E0066|nr:MULTISPECIES: hypothetical protein [unclassified Streptomyces]MCX5149714.1 hypothetical protein [Streptomyces sp. NBC_00320]WSN52753.1 hypothetical protein OG299_36250 [Streptomyces sp. NBC_01296]WSW57738.1 hypothetical protein OG513_03665 [Streptomyces sp. NBC_00998]
MANTAIRVRLTQGASESDIGALKAWLEREQKLETHRNNGLLEIHERAGTEGGPGSPMGAGMEIVLVLIGAAAPKLFDEVFRQVKSGVHAWRENRRSVERGEPPEVEVEPESGGR